MLVIVVIIFKEVNKILIIYVVFVGLLIEMFYYNLVDILYHVLSVLKDKKIVLFVEHLYMILFYAIGLNNYIIIYFINLIL